MTRKRIAASMLIGVLALVGVTGVSSAAPGPYDQAPTISLLKSNKRVKLKPKVIVGSARCGTGTCSVKATAFAAVRNSARFKARAIPIRSIASNTSAKLRVKLPRATLRAIRNSKTGHGHIKIRATITSSTGQSATAKGKVRFKAPKPAK